MGCHIWKYLPIDKLPKKEYEYLKKECDKYANKALNDSISLDEYYKIYKRVFKDATIDEVKASLEKPINKAKEYKEKIKTDPNALFYYNNLSLDYNGIKYIGCGCLDEYIRLYDYPEGIFESAEQLIEYCNKINWKSVSYLDNYQFVKVLTEEQKSEAINRIEKMFVDNLNLIVTFWII